MDIYDIKKKHGFSIRTLRKLEGLGLLKTTPIDNDMRKIKDNLRHGRRLTVRQMVSVIKKPDKDLKLYADTLEDHVAELGQYQREALTADETRHIIGASLREPESLAFLSDWLRTMIDTSPAFANGAEKLHAYIGVRMVFNSPETSLEEDLRRLNNCILRVRQLPEMAGYSTLHVNRIVSYHRVNSKKKVDVFDI